jgi:hypothetical protein
MNCVVAFTGALSPPTAGSTPDQPSQRRQRRLRINPRSVARGGGCNCGSQQHLLPSFFLATPTGLDRLRQPRNTFGRLQQCWDPAVRCPVSDDTFLCGAFSPRMSGWIGTCVGVVARRSRLWKAGAGENQCRGTGGSIRDGGVACRCCLSLAVLILCVFACRHLAGGFW